MVGPLDIERSSYIIGLFAIAGLDEVLGFIQDHCAQRLPAQLFFIGVAHFRVVRVRGGLASRSLFLDRLLRGGDIHLGVLIKGGFAQELQPLLVVAGAMEQGSIRWPRIDQESAPGALPIRSLLGGIQPPVGGSWWASPGRMAPPPNVHVTRAVLAGSRRRGRARDPERSSHRQ